VQIITQAQKVKNKQTPKSCAKDQKHSLKIFADCQKRQKKFRLMQIA